jgi:ABC-type uncharacterized transport system substrate-binding protein
MMLPPKYIMYTFSYGLVRKSIQMNNATITTYSDNRKKNVPLLYTDKALLIGWGALASVYLWPVFLWKDLGKIELYLDKTKDPKDYGYNKEYTTYTDYIFT